MTRSISLHALAVAGLAALAPAMAAADDVGLQQTAASRDTMVASEPTRPPGGSGYVNNGVQWSGFEAGVVAPGQTMTVVERAVLRELTSSGQIVAVTTMTAEEETNQARATESKETTLASGRTASGGGFINNGLQLSDVSHAATVARAPLTTEEHAALRALATSALTGATPASDVANEADGTRAEDAPAPSPIRKPVSGSSGGTFGEGIWINNGLQWDGMSDVLAMPNQPMRKLQPAVHGAPR